MVKQVNREISRLVHLGMPKGIEVEWEGDKGKLQYSSFQNYSVENMEMLVIA